MNKLIIFALIVLAFGAIIIISRSTKPSQIVEFIPKEITLDQILEDDHTWKSQVSIEDIRTIYVTGDVIPARTVNMQTTKYRNYKWPFEKTGSILRQADITFINLETPLIKDCPLSSEGFVFCGNEKHIEGLIFAGIDIASMANNHAGNHGVDAINYTSNLLTKNGIGVTGLNNILYRDIRGIRFAFLGYNDIGYEQDGISWAHESKIKSEIAEAKSKSDVVIVMYHWGVEYQNQPDDRQKYLGRIAVDNGADLVVGNHPHWIQPVEIYKGKVITYAHGNFIFDQEWSLETKKGVIGKYTFYKEKLVDVEFVPILIEDYGQPRLMESTEQENVIDHIRKQSKILSKSE